MKQIRIALLLLLTLIATYGCKEENTLFLPQAPDYETPGAWFDGGSDNEMAYDVFYIVPTCVFDWENTEGETCHYMDINNDKQRHSVEGPLRLAKGIFADEANFYAPYYRQITIESWTESDSVIEARFQYAFDDIKSAFRYYMTHFNQGKPFVLAGHSQGGKAVIELLKQEMSEEEYSRLIAAYPLGYPVKESDLSPYLTPATGATDTGVCVTFNTVSALDKLPHLLSGSRFAINPMNWRTDSVTAPKTAHLGTVFMNSDGVITSEEAHVLTAQLDEASRALVVTGVNPQDYYTPSLAALFQPGNYHVVELNFFFRNLQENVKARAAAFFRAD